MHVSGKSRFPSLSVKNQPKIIVSIRGGGAKVIKTLQDGSTGSNDAPATTTKDVSSFPDIKSSSSAKNWKTTAPKFLKPKKPAGKFDEVSQCLLQEYLEHVRR